LLCHHRVASSMVAALLRSIILPKHDNAEPHARPAHMSCPHRLVNVAHEGAQLPGPKHGSRRTSSKERLDDRAPPLNGALGKCARGLRAASKDLADLQEQRLARRRERDALGARSLPGGLQRTVVVSV